MKRRDRDSDVEGNLMVAHVIICSMMFYINQLREDLTKRTAATFEATAVFPFSIQKIKTNGSLADWMHTPGYLRNLDTKGDVSPRRKKWPEGPSPRNSENHDSCSISSFRIA
jgi:hypothetical protein